MDDWFGVERKNTEQLFPRVSILVVLDDWFGVDDRRSNRPDFAFQSLLFWMIGSGRLRFETPTKMNGVSILVVLDDWFGDGYCDHEGERGQRFNPCCFG